MWFIQILYLDFSFTLGQDSLNREQPEYEHQCLVWFVGWVPGATQEPVWGHPLILLCGANESVSIFRERPQELQPKRV